MRFSVLVLVSSAALFLSATPAEACEKSNAEASKAAVDEKKGTETQPAPNSVLAPVDEVLSATCSCGSAADCTCKKGECKCKKCSRHQKQNSLKKTELIKPINGMRLSPVLPQNARFDATAGTMI